MSVLAIHSSLIHLFTKLPYRQIFVFMVQYIKGEMMEYEEIQKRIYACADDEDIRDFVLERIHELEIGSEETTMGQTYTDTFNEYISSKVHYKPGAPFRDIGKECPDLVYDDIEPYVSLIKNIRKGSYYNALTLLTTIFLEIHQYLPNHDWAEQNRVLEYRCHIEKGSISIKEIKQEACGFCSERAGLSHNMFKLLGIDSSLVCGIRKQEGKKVENHAYNIIYPNGYNDTLSVIFDPSHHIKFINKEGLKQSFGYFKTLSTEDHAKMRNGETVLLDIAPSGEKLKHFYEGFLDGYEMQPESATYGIGLEKIHSNEINITNNQSKNNL